MPASRLATRSPSCRDRGGGHRAPPAPPPLPRLRQGDPRRAAGRSPGRRLRPPPGSGGGDTCDAQPRLAPRHGRADGRAVRRRGWRAERSMRSSPERVRLWQSPMRTCLPASAPPLRSTSMRRAGGCAAPSAPCGAPSLRGPPSFASPPTATSARPRRCSGEDFEGIRRLGSLVGLRRLRPGEASGLLVAPDARFDRPPEGLAAQKEFGEEGLEIAKRCSRPGMTSTPTATADV